MKKENWVWMPHPGHLIVGNECRFHLNTYVGGFIVSTVGEYFPDAPVRELLAESQGIKLEGVGDARRADYMKKVGYQEIGFERTYETMVFKAMRSADSCCPWRQESGMNLDMEGYTNAGDATKGHLRLCRKWAEKGRSRCA
jgi:hypothetical protein